MPTVTNEPTPVINITIPVADAMCASVLCTAFESGQCGMGYWACAEDIVHGSADPLADDYYKEIVISDDEGDDPDWRFTLDYAAIRNGIERVLSPGFSVNPTVRGYVMRAVCEDDAGHIDGDAADVIVQAACFNEIVYG